MSSPFLRSLVRFPVTMVSTVTMSTRYPAAAARSTRSLFIPLSRWMYNWNHRSGWPGVVGAGWSGDTGQVLDRGGGHRRQRVRQPVPLRRPRRGDLAPGVHHPRVPGGRQRQRERQIPIQQPRGGIHRGDLGQRAGLEPPAPERSQVALHRQLLIGAAVDVVEHRPRDQPAPHGTQVVDVVARPQPPAGRVELDWLHPDQLTYLRCPHVRDDNPARPARARAAPLSTRLPPRPPRCPPPRPRPLAPRPPWGGGTRAHRDARAAPAAMASAKNGASGPDHRADDPIKVRLG